MGLREVLKMGDPRLLAVAQPVGEFGTPELENLLTDMRETMHNLNGAGLAAPQIGVGLRVVIFGFDQSPRYPEAEPVPYTVLINPELTPIGVRRMRTGRDACPFPACAVWCRATANCATRDSMPRESPSIGR